MQYAFESFLPQFDIKFGKGTLKEVGNLTRRYGNKALLVTGKHSMKKLGFLDETIKYLKDSDIDVTIYDKVEPNPTVAIVDSGAKVAREKNCNVIVALGGGSAIDTAKAIAIGVTHFRNENSSIWDYIPIEGKKSLRITEKTLPIIAITSTSGTGSHVTTYSVITNKETNQKPGFSSNYIFPKVSIVDLDIVSRMSPELTANTGMDVLAHSMESFAYRGYHPMTDIFALRAIELVANNLPKAYSKPDTESRANMAVADTFAGLSIALSGCVLPHAMAHSISGHYPEIAHGLALAIVSPSIMKFNIMKADRETTKRYILIAKTMRKKVSKITKKEALKSVTALEELLKKIGLDKKLSDIGVEKEKIEVMARDAFICMKDCIDYNPTSVKKSDVIKIYQSAM